MIIDSIKKARERKKKENNDQNTIRPFSIIPWMYETELDKKQGIVLKDIKNGEENEFQGNLEDYVFFNESLTHSIDEIKNKILKKYRFTPGFCSMQIKNKKELMEHLKIIHELSYNHYVFGKEKNLRGNFPNYCCGESVDNLLLTLMEKGYPNAASFHSGTHNHAYNRLPFIFGKNKKRGFIIIDPTSDQLFKNKKIAPRNNIFISTNTWWEYKTDWEKGADLFPNSSYDSRFSNLYTLKNDPKSPISISRYIGDYFKEVFKSSIKVKVKHP